MIYFRPKFDTAHTRTALEKYIRSQASLNMPLTDVDTLSKKSQTKKKRLKILFTSSNVAFYVALIVQKCNLQKICVNLRSFTYFGFILHFSRMHRRCKEVW